MNSMASLFVRFSKVSMIFGSLKWFSLSRQGLMYFWSIRLYMSRNLKQIKFSEGKEDRSLKRNSVRCAILIYILDGLIKGPLCLSKSVASIRGRGCKGISRGSTVPVFSTAEANEATGVQKQKKWVSLAF